jgi:hypothetical protein
MLRFTCVGMVCTLRRSVSKAGPGHIALLPAGLGAQAWAAMQAEHPALQTFLQCGTESVVPGAGDDCRSAAEVSVGCVISSSLVGGVNSRLSRLSHDQSWPHACCTGAGSEWG